MMVMYSRTYQNWWLNKTKINFILGNTMGLKTGLDVGCGDGKIVDELNKRGKVTKGLDSDKKLVSLAKKRFGNNYYAMDATKMDFPDNSFDFVFCITTLHHIKNKQKALEEMLRVAKHKVLINELNQGNLIVKLFLKVYSNTIGKESERGAEYVNPDTFGSVIFNELKTHYWVVVNKKDRLVKHRRGR
jgi:ubiquinone/menaquinone biosynthesis C-methylase UbiE